jgi:hypothetical protein
VLRSILFHRIAASVAANDAPSATKWAGNHACLDLALLLGCTRDCAILIEQNRLIDWNHMCSLSHELFPDFAHLLGAFSEELDDGDIPQGR